MSQCEIAEERSTKTSKLVVEDGYDLYFELIPTSKSLCLSEIMFKLHISGENSILQGIKQLLPSHLPSTGELGKHVKNSLENIE